jgi:hypothetical protein
VDDLVGRAKVVHLGRGTGDPNSVDPNSVDPNLVDPNSAGHLDRAMVVHLGRGMGDRCSGDLNLNGRHDRAMDDRCLAPADLNLSDRLDLDTGDRHLAVRNLVDPNLADRNLGDRNLLGHLDCATGDCRRGVAVPNLDGHLYFAPDGHLDAASRNLADHLRFVLGDRRPDAGDLSQRHPYGDWLSGARQGENR